MLGMFTHAMATGQKEHDQAIHWGWQQPSAKWDLGAEPSTIDLIGPEMSQAEIRVIYNDIYQLWRSPRRSPCDEETGERIYQEILDIGQFPHSQRKNQSRVLPAPPSPRWMHRLSSKPGPVQLMITLRTCSKIPAKKP